MTNTTRTKNVPTLDDLRRGPTTLSVEQAAPYLGVSRAYCYQLVREGRLASIRLSERRVRIPTAALLRLLDGEG